MPSRSATPIKIATPKRPTVFAAVAIAAVSASCVVGLAELPAAGATAVGATLSVFAGTGDAGSETPGPATSSALANPVGIAVDAAGNVYVANTNSSTIDKISPDGVLSVYAGDGQQGAPTPGPATQSHLSGPFALALDSAGNLYSADSGQNLIFKITPAGVLSILAGTGAGGPPTPGPADASAVNYPTGLAADSAGNLFIADCNNNLIEKVTPAGVLSVFAGTGGTTNVIPGPALSSPVSCAGPLAVDANDNLYISDDNSQVSKVTPGGILSLYAGNGSSAAPTPGPATESPLNYISGLSPDGSGGIYLTDNGAGVIEQVDNAGVISVVAGTGVTYGTPTVGASALQTDLVPQSTVFDPSRNALLITDSWNRHLYKIGVTNSPGVITPLSGVGGNGEARLSFPVPRDNGSAITGYDVSLDGGRTWGPLTTVTTGLNVTATVTGLRNGTAYPVAVRARNSNGSGPASRATNVTPTGTPAVPGSVTVKPGDRSVVVSFTPPFDGGRRITAYEVTTDGGQTWTALPTTTLRGTVSGTVTGLTNGRSYSVAVRAANANGNGTASGLTSATPAKPAPPQATAPTAPRTVSATAGNATATIRFTAPAHDGGARVTSYTVTSHPGTRVATCPGSPCTVTGLTDGTAYAFTVHATNTAGNSVESALSAPVTPTGAPGAPRSVTVAPADKSLTVSFAVPANGGSSITGYDYSVDGGKTWHHLAATIRGSRVTGVIRGLRNGTNYPLAVRATNAHGPGAASKPVSAAPAAGWFTDPLSARQRAHLAGIPAQPTKTHGKARTTKAIYRTHNGSLAVPLARVGSHQLSKGQAVQLAALFRFDSATLTSASRHQVLVLARSMKSVRAVTCEGYTDYADYAGSRRHELTLSQKRAAVVCGLLQHELHRIHTTMVGYGRDRPLVIGGTRAQRAPNRRVVVLITG